MDIRGWPMDRIMQLPDCCFGRSWPIRFTAVIGAGATERYISPRALPERCVIWSIRVGGLPSVALNVFVELSLGDQDPTTDAIFDAFERVVPTLGGDRTSGYGFGVYRTPVPTLNMRLPIQSSGRRFAVKFSNALAADESELFIEIVISSMPTEVPDWLCSARV